ncbi:hypothetical protein GGR21_002930 [Dysgonomonas hofstadii]|uniref:Uncharacterized protein n=1 Tax=Dysgonomonas hofstadii TaxID=637886 RepID=A0A840CNN9_9BACT|nr:hypothetical protein [Dysgonomonas hofstadii]MBB4037016.1 hypothetical protein [Dysgonomonas hofstadii]
MFIIKEIRVIGVTRLKVEVETDNIEEFRRECARTYKVKLRQIKFIYEERE